METSRLAELQKRSWKDRRLGDVVYDSVVDKQYPVLTVFEQFEPNYMQLIDQRHGTITDFLDNKLNDNTELLAKSSAFAFFPECALVGRVSGNAGKV